MFKSKKKFVAGLLLVWVGLSMTGHAQEDHAAPEQGKIIPEEIRNANFQATYIWQKKSSFDAPYTGANSLRNEAEHADSFTATAFLGYRPWKGGELYFNPEAIQAAIALAASNGGVPDVTKVRKENAKVGYGFSAEQSLRSDIGIFARASWADGQTETYSFTEIERAISAGVAVKGDRWGRAKDTFGLALAQNGLDQIHRQYLSLDGIGAFIGDGRLSYRPERIVETYSNVNVGKGAWLATGFQHIDNPAYNADRGPVNVSSVRLHAEL